MKRLTTSCLAALAVLAWAGCGDDQTGTTPDAGSECTNGKVENCYTGNPNTRGVGICKDGTRTCTDGKWGACSGSVLPEASDLCDGKDNNCDGDVDEGCKCVNGTTQSCDSPCGKGEVVCVDGQWKNCTAPQPQQETCDGIDNNCNGEADEVCSCKHGTSESCYGFAASTKGVGQCKDGVHVCDHGTWGACLGEVGPAASENCNDTIDNDCDGMVNDGCTCTAGTTQSCGTDVGECVKGTQTCSANAWGPCANEVKAVAETCDGKDNDCNGSTDDGLKQDSADPNDSCAAARLVEVSDTKTTKTELEYTIYPSGDYDYIRVVLKDDLVNICVPFKDPKCNQVDIELVQPTVVPSSTGVDYRAIVYTDTCNGTTGTHTLSKTTPKVSLVWDGVCGLENSSELWIKVFANTNSVPKFNCKPYKLRLLHSVAIATCP